jgi:hypothetical protein
MKLGLLSLVLLPSLSYFFTHTLDVRLAAFLVAQFVAHSSSEHSGT